MTDTRKTPDQGTTCTCGHQPGMLRGHPSRCPMSRAPQGVLTGSNGMKYFTPAALLGLVQGRGYD